MFDHIASRLCLILAVSFSLPFVDAAEQQWHRFRGPDGLGVAQLEKAPTEWTANDFTWVKKLPGVGHSSLVSWGDDLFLTSGLPTGERLLICLDAATGETNWQEAISLTPSHLHKKNSYGSCTPVVGEEGVFVLGADTDRYVVAGYSHTGDKLWQSDLGSFTSQHGQGCSAILHDGLVIVPNDQMGASSVAALDARSGDVVWQTPKSEGKTAYATPVVATLDGIDVLITLSEAEGVTGLDPKTGKKLFNSGKVPLRVVASPIVVDGAVIISCGSGGRGKHMEAVVAMETDGEWTTSQRWVRKKLLPYVPTPVVHDGLLFLWNDDGIAVCLDPADGREIWAERIGGNFSASPLVINDKIYAISEEGVVEVIDASASFRQYPGGKINDLSYSTPAVIDGRIYFRGFSSLSCLDPSAAK